MKLKIKKDKLVEGLRMVAGAVKGEGTLPILGHVLMEAGNELRLTCTNLDMAISCVVPAEVKAAGKTTCSVGKLLSIVSDLPGSDLDVESDEKNVLSVRCGKSFYRLNGLSAEEFPAGPKIEGKVARLAQSDLKRLLAGTMFAMSDDSSRYVLCGVLMIPDGESFTVVGADGRRLALAAGECLKGESGKFIVPAPAAEEIKRLLSSGEAIVKFLDNAASFEMINSTGVEGFVPVTVTTKLIDGAFPNHQQVIPTEHKERIAVNRTELVGALRRSSVVTSDKSSSVRLEFGKNRLLIKANSPEAGDAEEEIDIKHGGAEISIAFNPKYLIEPLSALEEEEVFFELNDGLSPGVLKIDGPWLCVVSPMRLS